MRKIILFTSLFCIVISYAQVSNQTITKELTTLYEKSDLAGFAVALLNKDKVMYSKGFGFSSRENKTPYTTKTVQPIGSISKTFIGVALMRAQELGELDLDDDINDYLSFKIFNPNFKNEKITIRQLANHTSSIIDGDHYDDTYVYNDKIPLFYNDLEDDFPNKNKIKKFVDRVNRNKMMPVEDFIKKQYLERGEYYSVDNFLNNKPGSKYKYTNMGSNIAALIIEKATGVSYKEFVKREILKPLKMYNSGWNSKGFNLKNISSLYYVGYLMPASGDIITYADGNLMTSIDDFTNYFLATIKGYFGESNILSSKSYNKMLHEPNYKNTKKAVFWTVDSEKIGHSGSDIGVLAHAYFLKESGKGIVIFVNTSDTKNGAIEVRDIYRALLKHIKN